MLRVLDTRKVQEVVRVQMHIEMSVEEWGWISGILSAAMSGSNYRPATVELVEELVDRIGRACQ